MPLIVVRPGGNREDATANLAENRVSLRFDKVPDLSACSTYEAVRGLVRQSHPTDNLRSSGNWAGSLWNLRNPSFDQAVVAMPVNREDGGTYAVGLIDGPYQYAAQATDCHRRPVRWINRTVTAETMGYDLWCSLCSASSCFQVGVDQADKRLMGLAQGTPIAGSPEEAIAQGKPDPSVRPPEWPFTAPGFALLTQLHENPTTDTLEPLKDELSKRINLPFQKLFAAVVEQLPAVITAEHETSSRVFSNYHKNDFGRGGCWPYHWGAIYQRGSRRSASSQLYLRVDHDCVQYGFYIGEDAGGIRQRFRSHVGKHKSELVLLLEPMFSALGLQYGCNDDDRPRTDALGTWLERVDALGYRASIFDPADSAIERSGDAWVTLILNCWKALYPLVILANSDDPLPKIKSYLEEIDVIDNPPKPKPMPPPTTPNTHSISAQINPIISISALSAATGLAESTLDAWLAAIHRKGQAIIAGPPGTGKTFCARWLAAHLVGGGDGLIDIVQFHPAYTYEDFIEGIRPVSKPGGFPEYPVVPGRFLRFLAQAEQRTGTSVLIIDEINRANLAQVFGELMYLLEYRQGVSGPDAAPASLKLANGGAISIPARVVLLGTMNTADRSIALVDHALRRRFAILPLRPEYGILVGKCAAAGREPLGLALRLILEDINRAIDDRQYHLGISFFLGIATAEKPLDLLASVWSMEIEPYLEEFFADQPETARKFYWDQIKGRLDK